MRPSDTGPFPVVVILHAGGGFTAFAETRKAGRLRDDGFMVVAGCWFGGLNPADFRSPSLVECPAAPQFSEFTDKEFHTSLVKYANALVDTARTLPGADSKHVGIYGWSRGGAEVALMASTGTKVRAALGESGRYIIGAR